MAGSLGMLLRDARKREHLSQDELVAQMRKDAGKLGLYVDGLDRNTIGRWERDRQKPNSKHSLLVRLALRISDEDWAAALRSTMILVPVLLFGWAISEILEVTGLRRYLRELDFDTYTELLRLLP